jgi:hypothetical protein
MPQTVAIALNHGWAELLIVLGGFGCCASVALAIVAGLVYTWKRSAKR